MILNDELIREVTEHALLVINDKFSILHGLDDFCNMCDNTEVIKNFFTLENR